MIYSLNKLNISAPEATPAQQPGGDDSAKEQPNEFQANIAVVGAGGGGGNILTDIINRGIEHISFAATNTDHKSLANKVAPNIIKIPIGDGGGAGTNPLKARKAAEDNAKEYEKFLKDRDLLFITAALGKGTGSGVAPFLCELAKSLGILTVAIVAKGFTREGNWMNENAQYAIDILEKNTNAMFVVENDIILQHFARNKKSEAKNKANDSLYTAMNVIVNIIRADADVKADLADIRFCLQNMGYFMPGFGESEGENAGKLAVLQGLGSQFYQNYELRPTGRSIMQMTFGEQYNEEHIDQAFNTLREAAGGSMDFGIIPAENPIDNLNTFRVEFIVPVQKKTQPWKEEDAIINEPVVVPVNTGSKSQKPNMPGTPSTQIVGKDKPLFPTDEPNTHIIYLPNDGIKIIPKDEVLEPIMPKARLDDITGRPRGNEELKKLDEPAIKRYGGPKYVSEEISEEDELIRLLSESTDPTMKKEIIEKIIEKKMGTGTNK